MFKKKCAVPTSLSEKQSLFRRHELNSDESSASSYQQQDESYRFISMAVLTSTMMLAEVIVGFLSGSLTLLSDSLHMFSDLAALIVGYLAHRYSLKLNENNVIKEGNFDPYNTIGYLRMEVVGALINGCILLTLCFTMFMEALHRIGLESHDISEVDLVLIVGGLGLFINILGLIIFGHGSHIHGGHGHGHGHSHDSGGHSHSHDHDGRKSEGDSHNKHKKYSKSTHGVKLEINKKCKDKKKIDIKIKNNNVKLSKEMESVGNESTLSGESEIGSSLSPEPKSQSESLTLLQTPAKENISQGQNDNVNNNNSNNNKEKNKRLSKMNDDDKHNHNHNHNMNVRGVFLHVMADALGSVAVMVSALIIKFIDEWWTRYVDPITTLVMVGLISRATYPLVKTAINILLDKSPGTIDIRSVEFDLNNMDGVLNVHELHVWEVTPGNLMATVHLVIDPSWEINGAMTILDSSKVVLHQHGIHSSVVQREYAAILDGKWVTSEDPCFDLVCKDDECISQSTKLIFKKRRKSGTDCNNNNCMIDHGLSNNEDSIVDNNKSKVKFENENTNSHDNNNDNDNNSGDGLTLVVESPKLKIQSRVKK